MYGVDDQLTQNKDAIFVERTVTAITAAIRELSTNADLRLKVGNNVRRAVEKIDARAYPTLWIKSYQKLMLKV